MKTENNSLLNKISVLFTFVIFVIKRFQKDKCIDAANSLSYTSLLSVVPLFALIFAGFSSFPAFQSILSEFEQFIFSNFIPTSSDEIRQYVMTFVAKTSRITLVGLVSLVVLSLLLMWKIDQSLNKIWLGHLDNKRDYIKTLLTYWAILTIGPVLIGMSLMATSYLTSLPIINDAAEIVGIKIYIIQSIAVFFTFIALTSMYLIVPNTRVSVSHALIGGLVATLFFEIAKQSFTWYVSNTDTYKNIYGTLSIIPIFLIWIYISWVIALLGAMTARCLDLFNFKRALLGLSPLHNENYFISAYYILYLLWEASKEGNAIKESDIETQQFVQQGKELQTVLLALEQHHWIVQTDKQCWVISKNLDKLNLNELYQDLSFYLPKQTELSSLVEIINNINIATQETLTVSLHELFEREHQINQKT